MCASLFTVHVVVLSMINSITNNIEKKQDGLMNPYSSKLKASRQICQQNVDGT
jgi:hypothetical protein